MSSELKDNKLPMNQEQKPQTTQVVVAEVIEDDDSEQNYRQRFEGTASFGVHGRGFRQQNTFGQQNLSCLPAAITLILAVGMGVQAGFLASIGFLFFYAIGSALALTITVRRTLQGKAVYVWLNRILVWGVAFVITLGLTK